MNTLTESPVTGDSINVSDVMMDVAQIARW